MIRPRRYFPWKIARQYFVSHFVFVVVTLILTGFSLRYYAYEQFTRNTDIHSALARFDSYLTSLFLTVCACAGLYVALLTRTYSRPLGRLIQRARELRRLDAPIDDFSDTESIQAEEPGEWSDLERALNRVHRDLRSKTHALSREREELSALIGAVSDAILAIDQDGQPLFFNSQFAVLFRPAGENVGRFADERVHLAPQAAPNIAEIFRVPEILQGYKEVLRQGEMRLIAVTLHTTESEVPRHFSVSIAPLKSKDSDSVFGAIGVFHDITEMKASENIRIEFVGNASHELRTPITNIKGYLDTLKEDFKTGRMDNAGQFLDVVSRNVDRLVLLVNDLLDLSTLESGAQLKHDSVSTREVTEAALKQLETKRAARRQEVNVHYVTENVYGDARRVEQVLVNLIQNAIKYIPEGRQIDVHWERGANETYLRVKDNGPGVPAEHHSRLFERFYRVDAGRSRELGGTGLGLAIVKHIMIKHGGSVRLVSRTGHGEAGAEFICTFPD